MDYRVTRVFSQRIKEFTKNEELGPVIQGFIGLRDKTLTYLLVAPRCRQWL